MTRHACWMFLLIGCASPIAAVRDDNRRLDKEVTELREERRAQDRKLRDMQHQLDKVRSDKVLTMMASMPPLPVEVVAPPGGDSAPSLSPSGELSRVVAVTDDGTEIVYEGDAALGKAATWGDEEPTPVPRRAKRKTASMDFGGAGADRLEVTKKRTPSVSARVARTQVRDRGGDGSASERGTDAAADYRAAVALVRGGDSATAIPSLRSFLQKYPRHDYADNAQYWLGEAFYAQKDYPHALREFRTVIETYPRGNKVPDALLKVGFCYQALGQADKARAVLEQVVNLYPKTEPAVLASKRLDGGAQ